MKKSENMGRIIGIDPDFWADSLRHILKRGKGR